jgi:hypothetical protein
MLHTLTDAQDALFGTDFVKRLTLATWEADLTALGIVDGEPAWEDAQAHFTQQFTPDAAYIGRRGTTHEQVVVDVDNPFNIWDIDVTGTTDGSYEVTVPGEASSPFTFAASSSTSEQIVDGLIAAFVAAGTPITSFTWEKISTSKITLTATAAGFDLDVSATAPGGPDLTATETQVHTVPDGAYTVTIPGETPTTYSFTASTSTAVEVIAGIEATMDAAAIVDELPAGNLPTLKYVDTSAGDLATLTITDLAFLGSLSVTVTPNMTATATQARVVRQAQETLIFIAGGAAATDGLYTLTVSTSTGQKQYTHTASTESANAVATALKVAFDADPSDLVTAPLPTPVGGTLFLAADLAGEDFTATIASPGADATSTVRLVNRDVKDDIVAAQNGKWYMLLLGSHEAVDFEPALDYVETQKMESIVQSSDVDVGTDVDTDIYSKLKAKKYNRSWGVWHDNDAEGVHAGWAGRVLTFDVGQTQFPRKELRNLTGIEWTPTDQRSAFIKDKTGSYLERFDAKNVDLMMGSGLNFNSRVADIMRAVDTLQANMEGALLDVYRQNEILPYSDDGVGRGSSALRNEANIAVNQGYMIPGSFVLTDPDLTTATATQREQGEWPPFKFTARLTVGSTLIIVNGEVGQ